MVYDHPQFPAALKAEIRVAAGERQGRAEGERHRRTVHHKARKAIGPFKRQLWSMDAANPRGHRRGSRGAVLVPHEAAEDQQHGRNRRSVRDGTAWSISRAAEVAAAGGVITASERKAEGLSD